MAALLTRFIIGDLATVAGGNAETAWAGAHSICNVSKLWQNSIQGIPSALICHCVDSLEGTKHLHRRI